MNETDQKDLFEHMVEFLKAHSARELIMIATDAMKESVREK